MRKYFEFYSGAKIKCGESALMTLGTELSFFGARTPLLLSSTSAEKLGLIDKVKAAISADAVDEIVCLTNLPTKFDVDMVSEVKKTYLAKKCDAILAVGGEGVMDTAKCLKLFLTQECDEIIPLLETSHAKGKEIPLIAIPTENGSGKEASGILESGEVYTKTEVIVPNVVIIDEDTAMTAPSRTVAACGIYALANAIESYVSADEEDLSALYAEAAIKLLGKNLENAVKDGENEGACRATALAGTLAGISYGNLPFGAAHALAEGLAQVTGESLEEMYALSLVPAMKQAKDTAEDRLKGVLYCLIGANEYAEVPDRERAGLAIAKVEEILERLQAATHIQTKIRNTKIMRESFGAIADAAAGRRAAITAFSPLSRDDFIALLNEAY